MGIYKSSNILKSSTWDTYWTKQCLEKLWMALIVINKINKLKFLHHKNGFLTQALRCLLCNALIQPHLIMNLLPGIQI